MSAEGRRESLRAFDHANKRSELPTLSGLTSEEEEEEEEEEKDDKPCKEIKEKENFWNKMKMSMRKSLK